MRRRAVFLDRDGTLNVDKGFVHAPRDFEFVEGAVEAVKRLKESGFVVVVVTNQSGVGRGLYTERDVRRLHRWVNGELGKRGTTIDRFYFCPHHPDARVRRYRRDCPCRKPGPGMLLRAMSELGIEPRASYMIGDAARDVTAGKKAGVTAILIRARGTMAGETAPEEKPDAVFDSLLDAARYVTGAAGV
jgi:D-glycero-D-manno-heptose 1,7-bisphosphate phosphatase